MRRACHSLCTCCSVWHMLDDGIVGVCAAARASAVFADPPLLRVCRFTGLQLCSDCDTMASYVKNEGAQTLTSHARNNCPGHGSLNKYWPCRIMVMPSHIAPAAELVSDCRRCCTRGKSMAAQKYRSAVLEAFLERLSAFPHIEGFVNREAAKYKPALKVPTFTSCTYVDTFIRAVPQQWALQHFCKCCTLLQPPELRSPHCVTGAESVWWGAAACAQDCRGGQRGGAN